MGAQMLDILLHPFRDVRRNAVGSPGIIGNRDNDNVVVRVNVLLDPVPKLRSCQGRLDEEAALEGLRPTLVRLQVIDEVRVILSRFVEVVIDPVNCHVVLLL